MKNKFLIAALTLCLLFGLTTQVSHAQNVTEKKISLYQAKQIALKKIKGKIIFAKEDKEDGIMKYEIIIKAKDGSYEVEVDKVTGKVLAVEKEGLENDDDAGYND